MKTKQKNISAGAFKAGCLKLMDDVSKKRFRLTITKRGKPIAMLVPLEQEVESIFGCLKDSMEIRDDIVDSTGEVWEADSE